MLWASCNLESLLDSCTLNLHWELLQTAQNEWELSSSSHQKDFGIVVLLLYSLRTSLRKHQRRCLHLDNILFALYKEIRTLFSPLCLHIIKNTVFNLVEDTEIWTSVATIVWICTFKSPLFSQIYLSIFILFQESFKMSNSPKSPTWSALCLIFCRRNYSLSSPIKSFRDNFIMMGIFDDPF